MNPSILPGIIRGLGKARIQFDKAYENRKILSLHNKQISILEKIDFKNKDFSKSSVFKASKLISDSVFDEVIFWTLLKLIHSEENGGICIPKNDLVSFIKNQNPKLQVEIAWQKYLDQSGDNSLLAFEGEMVYLKSLYQTESFVCDKLKLFFETSFPEKFKLFKDKNLSAEQIQIINSILKNGISFVSGGPGTGKTTIIQSILKAAIENKINPEEIALLAPTGKAAKRLQESCQTLIEENPSLEPSTIHRFLKYSPKNGKFRFNSENPIPHKLIILDESSMIDIFTLKALLEAYTNEDKTKRIVFVGDPDQLLSVNTGSIFSDFISLNRNLYTLTQSFRQSKEGEDIKTFANYLKNLYKANHTPLPEIITIEKNITNSKNGVRALDLTKNAEILNHALEWYKIHSQTKESIQILTPYNETEIGIKQVNSYLEENLPTQSKIPVIVRQNLYNLGIFNGETGLLEQAKTHSLFYPANKEKIEISESNLQYFNSAYAITVHKSQGSEYDHVCLLLPAELEEPDSLLNIRIIYTAITRAKKSVTIIGSLSLFQKSLLNKGEERHSRISNILK